jgi:GH24 family phage-related lysozyme (muramidase)
MFVPSVQLAHDMMRHEGYSASVYADSRGLATQGIGRHHGVKFGDPDIDEQTAFRWLAEDMQAAYSGAIALVASLDTVDLVRREAIVELVFNMGADTLAQFKPLLKHVAANEWSAAAFHLLTNTSGHLTPYTLQTGARAAETALRIATGEVLEEFQA